MNYVPDVKVLSEHVKEMLRDEKCFFPLNRPHLYDFFFFCERLIVDCVTCLQFVLIQCMGYDS